MRVHRPPRLQHNRKDNSRMNAKMKFIALFASIALVGCTHKNPPRQPRAEQFEYAQIHVDSNELRRDTYVGQPRIDRDSAGQLVHVTVPIRSAVDKTLYVDYYVTFFDRDGHVIGSKLGPMTKTLQPSTPDYIEFNSTSARAVEFQLDLRYAR